jgi:acetyltransferase-like isoleucine patch superfamily enzyme
MNREHIEANSATVGDGVVIGANSLIRADRVVLRDDVRIGDNVEIHCDTLELGPGCKIGAGSRIVCPGVVVEEGCTIAPGFRAELNQSLELGRHSIVGPGGSMTGQGVRLGQFVFLDEGLSVGGGGARGPRAFLTVGDRTSIFARSFINLSERVEIGKNVGISFNVAFLTHNAWQPVLKGYTAQFAPISVQDNATIYFNVVVLPGVTIGEWSTIGAGSVVRRDVPARCLAAGNPAQVVRGPQGYPRPLDDTERDELIRSILADYLTGLDLKGVRLIEDRMACAGYAIVEFEGRLTTISHLAITLPQPTLTSRPDITLSEGPSPDGIVGGCHFDLEGESLSGETNGLAEDLRDYLRRRGIRVFTDRPFRSLPLANLQRLMQRSAPSTTGGLTHVEH